MDDYEIEFAPGNYLEIYADEVNEVLKVVCEHLGIVDIDNVWVSDESTLWDFEDNGDLLAIKVSKKLGIEVNEDDLIFEIAKRIYDAKNK